MPLSYIDFHRRLTSNLADFQRAADAVRDAMVWVFGPQGQLVMMNAAGLRHLGLPLDVVKHMDRTLLVHPDDRVTLEVSRWYLMTHRRYVTGLYRVWCADQCYRRMLCDSVPVAGPDDRGIAYLAVGAVYERGRRMTLNTHELFLKLLGLDRRRAYPTVRPSWQTRRREDAAEIISLIDRWEQRKPPRRLPPFMKLLAAVGVLAQLADDIWLDALGPFVAGLFGLF